MKSKLTFNFFLWNIAVFVINYLSMHNIFINSCTLPNLNESDFSSLWQYLLCNDAFTGARSGQPVQSHEIAVIDLIHSSAMFEF